MVVWRPWTGWYPSRSPDPNFFLWGILKNDIYAQKSRTVEQLKEKVVDACDKITADLCRKVCNAVVKRVDKCIDVNGQHFEQLL
jgi:hypothetical protein